MLYMSDIDKLKTSINQFLHFHLFDTEMDKRIKQHNKIRNSIFNLLEKRYQFDVAAHRIQNGVVVENTKSDGGRARYTFMVLISHNASSVEVSLVINDVRKVGRIAFNDINKVIDALDECCTFSETYNLGLISKK